MRFAALPIRLLVCLLAVLWLFGHGLAMAAPTMEMTVQSGCEHDQNAHTPQDQPHQHKALPSVGCAQQCPSLLSSPQAQTVSQAPAAVCFGPGDGRRLCANGPQLDTPPPKSPGFV